MYSVKFRKDAEKEWKKLDKTIQSQFAKQLIKRCENPHVALRDPLIISPKRNHV